VRLLPHRPMQTRMLILAAAAVAAMTCKQAAAAGGFLSGTDLYRYCIATTQPYETGACEGYILGVMDRFEASRENAHLRHCTRSGMTGEQVKDVVFKYLTDNPQIRGQPAWALVTEAVMKAWCK
jgi:hypothetical protein